MPEQVGRYEILLPIASGGMATVFLARSRGVGGFEREVAVKLTHAHLREASEFALDLIEEAKLAVRIRHPNVVPTLDVGEDPLGLFLVMEYVEGDTLAGLRRRAESTEENVTAIAMRVLIDALWGLHAAHELKDDAGQLVGLVHRDFSPQNILVGVDGMGRLTDFGVAKAASRLGHTQTGAVKGKIAYMSPEQARGQPIDRRCDVWAAGVMAWEILSGRRLFSGDNEVTTLLQIVTERPPRLRDVDPRIPAAFDEVVARALEPNVAWRTPSAGQMARELTAACHANGSVAETADVAELVQRLVGPKLAERRARVAGILELRAKMGKLANPPMDAQVQTPISDVGNPWFEGHAAGARSGGTPAVAASSRVVPPSSSTGLEVEAATQTVTALISGEAAAADGTRHARLLGRAVIAAGLVSVAAAGLFVLHPWRRSVEDARAGAPAAQKADVPSVVAPPPAASASASAAEEAPPTPDSIPMSAHPAASTSARPAIPPPPRLAAPAAPASKPKKKEDRIGF